MDEYEEEKEEEDEDEEEEEYDEYEEVRFFCSLSDLGWDDPIPRSKSKFFPRFEFIGYLRLRNLV